MSRALPIVIALVLSSLLAAGCATAPRPRMIDDTVALSAPYDDVWSGVVETLAELNLPIDNMEKASGLVTTDWMSFNGTKNDEYCDCGGLGLTAERLREGKFNVFVKLDEATGETSVKVNTMYRQVRYFGDIVRTIDCVSTGHLESTLHAKVREKL